MYSRDDQKRVDDRVVTELVGLVRGIIADGKINEAEVKYLLKWMVANREVVHNPAVNQLYHEMHWAIYEHEHTDLRLAALIDILGRFTASDFEIGEDLRSTTAFFDNPVPKIIIPEHSFCFTGTCLFGNRKECEAAVVLKGGKAVNLNGKTDFLVIGEYGSDEWIQSSFGRKIEAAVEMRSKGCKIKIIAEADWRAALER